MIDASVNPMTPEAIVLVVPNKTFNEYQLKNKFFEGQKQTVK